MDRALSTLFGNRRLILICLVIITMVGVAGLALGYAAGKYGLLWRARDWWIARTAEPMPPGQAAIVWSEHFSNYHLLDAARLPAQRAYMLEQAGEHILFSSRLGRLYYLNNFHVTPLGVDVPMGFPELRAAGHIDNPSFHINFIRVTDLLTVQEAPGRYNLYAAHIAAGAECYALAVSRIAIAADARGVRPTETDWTLVFKTEPCIAYHETGAPMHGGEETGGRLVRLNESALALSVGVFARHDEVLGDYADSHLGKIVEIPLNGAPARIYARGFRNPQGLLREDDGDLWSTGHGPQGGDELNLVQRGRDYGWPVVGYGLSYSTHPQRWRLNREFSGHSGFTPPRFAWTPSIGVSNLIRPDERVFPNWSNHLLVASLRGNALRLLRMEGHRVVFDEPILFSGDRIRDLISLHDGRIAFSTDGGDIVLLSNREQNHPARAHILTGLNYDVTYEEQLLASPIRFGSQEFATQCAQCHSVRGEVLAGPPLNDLMGRRVGRYPGFAYSQAMSDRDEHWTQERLVTFLNAPEQAYPGTAMPHIMIGDWEKQTVAAYLATLTE